MGIKMGVAFDSAGVELHAETYIKGSGEEPLKCYYCATPVTHRMASFAERDGKPYQISAYFRLLSGGQHESGCKFAVRQEVEIIASESYSILDSIEAGKYRLRLVLLRDILRGNTGSEPIGNATDGDASEKKGTTYVRASGTNLAYINSAQRVLKLRAICDDDHEIAELIELFFDGSVVINWSQFFFETDRFHEAYRAISESTTEYPIALHGIVRDVLRPEKGSSCLHIKGGKRLPNPDDPKNCTGVGVTVWSPNAAWFEGVKAGDEVVVLGIWNVATSNTRPEKYGHFDTITFKNMSLTLRLQSQIALVPKP